MKVTDYNVICFHLQVLYGISVKRWEKKRDPLFTPTGPRVFGAPLENLPPTYIPDFGLVPSFLVQACSLLTEQLCTVGLFRKPGSLPRIKALRARLNRGEDCLSTALPYDVATLIKQFCRELPEPLFPSVLHSALLKAQALSKAEDRTSALQLLSCLLPARNASTLHYLLSFLHTVSQSCSDNLMSSLNLATVWAPCLLPPPNQTEMSESRLELRVLLLRSFIQSPQMFGVIPKSVLDSMEFLMDPSVPKDWQIKGGNQKRHSSTVKRVVRTIPWIQACSRTRPGDPEPPKAPSKTRPGDPEPPKAPSKTRPGDPEPPKAPSQRPGLRRSLGHHNFPNIQVFRSCLPWEAEREQSYTLAEEDSVRQERVHSSFNWDVLSKKTGPDRDSSPVLTRITKLHLGSRKRRSI